MINIDTASTDMRLLSVFFILNTGKYENPDPDV